MRAYRKKTRHPVCVYLTDEEAQELIWQTELVDLNNFGDPIVVFDQLRARLERVTVSAQLPL